MSKEFTKLMAVLEAERDKLLEAITERDAFIDGLEAEKELLKQKLTQDPKDARCQLYKQTQKCSAEAKRLNSENEGLKLNYDHYESFDEGFKAGLAAAAQEMIAKYYPAQQYEEDIRALKEQT